MNPRWMFRMKRWAQNPPSQKRVIFVFAIIGICLGLAAIEYFIGWPDALSQRPRGWRWSP